MLSVKLYVNDLEVVTFTLSVCISLTSLKHYKNQRVENVNWREGKTRERKPSIEAED